jgi:hypothetical protein
VTEFSAPTGREDEAEGYRNELLSHLKPLCLPRRKLVRLPSDGQTTQRRPVRPLRPSLSLTRAGLDRDLRDRLGIIDRHPDRCRLVSTAAMYPDRPGWSVRSACAVWV